MRLFVLPVNPEPWAIGPVGYARRGGKMSAYVGRNQQLDAYQQAVKEALGPQEMETGEYTLHFWFWRNRADYTTAQGRRHRKHDADLTNLQKATEDALQGVLIANDRDVRQVHSVLVEQGPDVIPAIVVGVEAYVESELPAEVVRLLDINQQMLPFDDDSARWQAPGEGTF